ncbi:hypothetical protein ACQP3J_34145, partial [Escherichia coli]
KASFSKKCIKQILIVALDHNAGGEVNGVNIHRGSKLLAEALEFNKSGFRKIRITGGNMVHWLRVVFSGEC